MDDIKVSVIVPMHVLWENEDKVVFAEFDALHIKKNKFLSKEYKL